MNMSKNKTKNKTTKMVENSQFHGRPLSPSLDPKKICDGFSQCTMFGPNELVLSGVPELGADPISENCEQFRKQNMLHHLTEDGGPLSEDEFLLEPHHPSELQDLYEYPPSKPRIYVWC